MTAKTLMIVGTMSSAGKSLLVTGLCRIYARKGIRVAPFKSQNMSNNAAVCADGSEIGRAQYTQAIACGLKPTAMMNPILLKPEANSRSQVIVMGKAYARLSARNYYKYKKELWKVATKTLDDLCKDFDLVIIEGAGSPVELNLKKGDIVNMNLAKYAEAPVLLAGDIDRGGIFPQLLGTLWLLEPEERKMIKGLIVNKFRGDITLFKDGITILEEKGGVPVIGVVPYVSHNIPEEDSVAIEAQNILKAGDIDNDIDIAVIRLPRISNFDDFDPLKNEPDVRIRYIERPEQIGNPSAIILPGTKSTIPDLIFLHKTGMVKAIQEYRKQGGVVVGICGGYQMMGKTIRDPENIESAQKEVNGLGLIPTETTFKNEKTTHQIKALIKSDVSWLADIKNKAVTGYEIHMGTTKMKDSKSFYKPLLQIENRSGEKVSVMDGIMQRDGRVWGCYIHGIFKNDSFRHAWLKSLGSQYIGQIKSFNESLDESFDELADVMETALDMDFIDKLIK